MLTRVAQSRLSVSVAVYGVYSVLVVPLASLAVLGLITARPLILVIVVAVLRLEGFGRYDLVPSATDGRAGYRRTSFFWGGAPSRVHECMYDV